MHLHIAMGIMYKDIYSYCLCSDLPYTVVHFMFYMSYLSFVPYVSRLFVTFAQLSNLQLRFSLQELYTI